MSMDDLTLHLNLHQRKIMNSAAAVISENIGRESLISFGWPSTVIPEPTSRIPALALIRGIPLSYDIDNLTRSLTQNRYLTERFIPLKTPEELMVALYILCGSLCPRAFHGFFLLRGGGGRGCRCLRLWSVIWRVWFRD